MMSLDTRVALPINNADAVLTSAERIGQYIEADPTRAGMGTTLTALLWQQGVEEAF